MATLRSAFQKQLDELQEKLMEMGRFVENMLTSAIQALISADDALAQKVILDDDTADQMDIDIEQMCMRLLALQQPLGKDLRTIGTALKIITDLERIGDYSVDIARIARRLISRGETQLPVDISPIARTATAMVREALESFLNRDLDLVNKVCADDNEVDSLWHSLRDELIHRMQQNPQCVPQAVDLLLVARYLERVADHSTNVAERVWYTETGELAQLARSHRARLEERED